MGFANETAVEISIQGLSFHEVRDFEGELIGSFANYASAMGAQRDFNIKKMMIKKIAVEEAEGYVFSCEFEPDEGKPFTAYVGKNGSGYWIGAHADLKHVVSKLTTANPSYKG